MILFLCLNLNQPRKNMDLYRIIASIFIIGLVVVVNFLRKQNKGLKNDISYMYVYRTVTIDLDDGSSLIANFFVVKYSEDQFQSLYRITEFITASMNATRQGADISFNKLRLNILLKQRGIHGLDIQSSRKR